MWRETTKHERNRRIWEEELEDFVPARVLDFHVHLFDEATIPSGCEAYSCAGHPIRSYDLAALSQDLDELYPKRETSAVVFGLPHVEYDLQANNAYVSEVCDGKRFFPLRLFDPETDTPEQLEADLASGRFLGLKPYLNYVRKPDLNEVQISEMLPNWAMEIVNARGLLVMLHIPRKDRLADPLNQIQLRDLCRSYPAARIVLAHVGRAYFLKNVRGTLDNLTDLPNLYYDLAMVSNPDVLEYVFRTAPRERVLYATDLPIAVAPGKSVEINNQYTYITPVPWPLSLSDDRGKLVFTSFLYEELRGIRTAVERCELGSDFVDALFYDNGQRLLDAVQKPGGVRTI
ncbi:MAG TPA: amidohydrolase family protein [Candidatus Hydrogenedentes bacterium]|jgi:hypothetical protein|nr:amidohydrolase family protein [Candidatus Hydrogenedentota bacterium]